MSRAAYLCFTHFQLGQLGSDSWNRLQASCSHGQWVVLAVGSVLSLSQGYRLEHSLLMYHGLPHTMVAGFQVGVFRSHILFVRNKLLRPAHKSTLPFTERNAKDCEHISKSL